MSTDTISLERRLASAQLRPLLHRYIHSELEGADLALFDHLMVQLADGDCQRSADALNTLVLKLNRGNEVQEVLLGLYANSQLDVIGIREGEFIWVPTRWEVEAAADG